MRHGTAWSHEPSSALAEKASAKLDAFFTPALPREHGPLHLAERIQAPESDDDVAFAREAQRLADRIRGAERRLDASTGAAIDGIARNVRPTVDNRADGGGEVLRRKRPRIFGSVDEKRACERRQGLVFGVTSLVKATITPGVTSFVFSPFVTIGGYSGNMWSAVIAIVPRVCIGIVAYYVYKLIMKVAHGIKGSQTVALWVAGIAGAMTNTLLVMNGIYIFFGQSYAAASNKAVEHIYDVILGIILGFGVPEAIVAGILTTAITKVLLKIMKNNG